MNKKSFIDWLKTTDFEWTNEEDYYFKRLIDYANYVYDELFVEEKYVEFNYEVFFWGGIEYIKREMSFEEFIEAYNNDTLKY